MEDKKVCKELVYFGYMPQFVWKIEIDDSDSRIACSEEELGKITIERDDDTFA